MAEKNLGFSNEKFGDKVEVVKITKPVLNVAKSTIAVLVQHNGKAKILVDENIGLGPMEEVIGEDTELDIQDSNKRKRLVEEQ